MDWQDYTVWVVGLTVAALIVRRLVCFARGRGRGGCAACGTKACPLKKAARRGK